MTDGKNNIGKVEKKRKNATGKRFMRFVGTPARAVALAPWVERHLPQINAPDQRQSSEKKEGGHKDS